MKVSLNLLINILFSSAKIEKIMELALSVMDLSSSYISMKKMEASWEDLDTESSDSRWTMEEWKVSVYLFSAALLLRN